MLQLESLPKETLIKLIKMYSKNWYTVDGLWFRNVEDEFGTEVATRLDGKMWQKQAEVEARRIKDALGITEGGFEALIKVINFMTWSPGEGFRYEFERIAPEQLNIYFTVCQPQEARLRQRLNPFPCKQVGIKQFNSVIKIVDPRIKVECLCCPPDPHPQDIWCKWAFTLVG